MREERWAGISWWAPNPQRQYNLCLSKKSMKDNLLSQVNVFYLRNTNPKIGTGSIHELWMLHFNLNYQRYHEESAFVSSGDERGIWYMVFF